MKYFYIEQALILKKKTQKKMIKVTVNTAILGLVLAWRSSDYTELTRPRRHTHTHAHKHTQCAQPNPSQSSSFSVIHAAAVHCWKNREIVLHMFSCRNKCWRSGQMKKKPRRPSTSTETHFYLLQVHTHRRTAETQACQ